MGDLSIDVMVFAPLAPILCVLLFWFIQLLFIESEKYLLEQVRPKHKPLCRFTNFLGILFQTICHALGYTVTKSGVSNFHITIHYGKVKPKKEREGVFEWISNAFLFIGPFFIPPALLLICLFFLIQGSFEIISVSQLVNLEYSFGGQTVTFGASLYVFSKDFLEFLVNIDFLHPAHLGFTIFMVLLGLGIRPLYIKDKRHQKVDLIYDLRNVWGLIRQKPLYLFFLFLMCYILFYLSLFLEVNWYIALFVVFGWLSITAIISILVANLVLLFIKATDGIERYKRIIPFVVIPISYLSMRVFFYYFQSPYTYSMSLLVMLLSTFLVVLLLLRSRTNKFKTNFSINPFSKFSKKRGEK
ncbi:MAG: hypothetical protein V5A64_00210 [Candidatus Thermoplasmatota archaeon]